MTELELIRTLDALQIAHAKLTKQHVALGKRFDTLQARHNEINQLVRALEEKENR